MVTFDFRQTAPWLGMGPVIDTENSADARAKLRALMIFVDFPNCRASDAEAPYNGTAYYREILADDGLRVMNALSYGRLDLTIDCADGWYTMPKADAEYKMERVITHEIHAAYIADACDVCADDYNLDDYDIFYVVPVKGSAVPYSPTMVSKKYPARGKRNKSGLCVTFGADMHFRKGLLLAHETGHILGLPDYYSYRCAPGGDFAKCGGWSLMGLIEGFAPDWFLYDKWRLGFLPDERVEVIGSAGEHEVKLAFSEEDEGKMLVLIPVSETRAYAAEVRTAAGLDEKLAKYGKRGIILYEMDGTRSGGYDCLNVIPKAGFEEFYGKLDARVCREFVTDGESVSLGGVTAVLCGDTIKWNLEKKTMELFEIEKQAAEAARELCEIAKVKEGGIVVVGCSSSEVGGGVIGHDSSPDIAAAVYRGIVSVLEEKKLYLAAQCCEHLNRAIVVEREAVAAALAVSNLGLTVYREVNAVPQPKAGGSFGTCAYKNMKDPVVLDGIAADAGLDIGGTLIGMHLKKVAVPVRLSVKQIGCAMLLAARTRIPFTGGGRAVYDEEKM